MKLNPSVATTTTTTTKTTTTKTTTTTPTTTHNNNNNNNHSLGDDPLTPAKGSTPTREASPLGGRGLDQLTTHYPIPDLPPYAVRTPHIHGATAYGAPNSSGGLMMMI